MLFVGTKSIAYATSHTLEITGETSDTSNKDEGGGDWSAQEVNLLSWSASTENLYSLDGKGSNFDDLFDMMIAKTPIDAVFAPKSEKTLTLLHFRKQNEVIRLRERISGK